MIKRIKNKYLSNNVFIKLLPFFVFLVLILILIFLKRASLKTFWIAAFFGLMTAFIVSDKEDFQKKCVSGFKDNHIIICLLIFIFSGILSNILKISGLTDALTSLFLSLGLNSSFFPAVFYLICCIISTICGTSTGTISFSVPLFVPIAVKCGLNPYLVLGAIASGSFFGDHLSPISDTTLLSVNATKCDMYKMMKERTIIAIIVFIIAIICYMIFGFFDNNTIVNINYNSSLKPLILITIPIVMIFSLKKNKDILNCLIFCDLYAIILSLILGIINLNDLFSVTSAIISGIESVIGVVIFLILLFTLIEFLPQKKIYTAIDNMFKKIKSPILSNFLSCIIIIIFMLCVSNNTAAMSIESPVINKLLRNKSLEKKANIFDALSVGVSGILPYNTAFMLMLSLAFSNGIVSTDFSLFKVSIYSFSCILFIIVYIFLALKKDKYDVKV